MCYLSLGLQSVSAQDLTLSPSVNVDPGLPTPTAPSSSTAALWLCWAISFPRGSHVLSPGDLPYLCSLGVLLVHHKLLYTWQLKMTSVYHLLISVGQKSRLTVPGLAAQVLTDLKSSVSGLHSHQRSSQLVQMVIRAQFLADCAPGGSCSAPRGHSPVLVTWTTPSSKWAMEDFSHSKSPSCFKSLWLWSFSPRKNLFLRRALVMRSSSMKIISCS